MPEVLPYLLHGEETEVWGDQGYVGQTQVIAEVAPQARDCINRRCLYHGKLNVEEFLRNREKSKVRSKVEHVFQVLKVKFGFVKVRYRGIRKNGNASFALCALVKLQTWRQETAAYRTGVTAYNDSPVRCPASKTNGNRTTDRVNNRELLRCCSKSELNQSLLSSFSGLSYVYRRS